MPRSCTAPLTVPAPVPNATLVSLFLLIRHGARTPAFLEGPGVVGDWHCGNHAVAPPHRIPVVNGDPVFLGVNSSARHPFPPDCSDGVLLDHGFDQLQALGAAYRPYLTDSTQLLPPTFDPLQVSIKSSHIQRAIASAVGFIHGLYPPDTDGESLSVEVPGSMGTNPLVPGELALFQILQGTHGPTFADSALLRRVAESRDILKPIHDSVNLSGDVHPLKQLLIGDLFMAYRCSGKPVSDVVTDVLYDRMMSDIDFVINDYLIAVTEAPFVPIWKMIDSEIDAFYERKSRARFTLLSGHDMTLAAVLAGIGRPNITGGTPYASHLAVEMWHLGRPLLRFVLNGEVLKVAGQELTPLSEFRKRFAA